MNETGYFKPILASTKQMQLPFQV